MCARVCVCGEDKEKRIFPLVRRLAGLGTPWRPRNTHTNGNRVALRSCLLREMHVFRSFKTGLAGIDLPAVYF